MGLNELVEEQSIKSISLRTMISEDNIKHIVSEDYSGLTKAKALGFLSILEREYQLDLKDVRHNAITYFEMLPPEAETNANIALPRVEEPKGRSKLFFFIMLGLLGYASWYFFTQFDKKTLNNIVPFGSEHNKPDGQEDKKESIFSVAINEDTIKEVEVVPAQNNNNAVEVAETKVVVATVDHNITESVQENVTVVKDEPSVTVVSEDKNVVTADVNISADAKNIVVKQTTHAETDVNNTTVDENNVADSESTDTSEMPAVEEKIAESTKAFLKPVKRLWFGLVNMRTGKRDHFSIRKPFTIDLNKGDWLVATSPAPFSLVFKEKMHTYNNGRAHYFMITQEGIIPLKKRAYVRKGGYRKW